MDRKEARSWIRPSRKLAPAGGICALILCVLIAGGFQARAEPRLYSQETKHFRVVYYSPQHEYLAPLLIRSLENAEQFYKEKYGYEPIGKITILIQDFDDSGYGAAGTVPTDLIQMGIPKGPKIREILNTMLDAVLSDPSVNTPERLRELIGAGRGG